MKSLNAEIIKKDALFKNMNTVEASLKTLKSQEDSMTSELAQLKGSIDQLKQMRESLNKDIGAQSESLRQLQSAQAATDVLKAQQTLLKQENDQLKLAISAKKSEIEKLK